MKINLKFGRKQEPVQTGLQVHTHMLVGLCSCPAVDGAGWQCDDDKGNALMVWTVEDMFRWKGQYCTKPVLSECQKKCNRNYQNPQEIPPCLMRCPS
jgi:hypothetical protein